MNTEDELELYKLIKQERALKLHLKITDFGLSILIFGFLVGVVVENPLVSLGSCIFSLALLIFNDQNFEFGKKVIYKIANRGYE